MLGELEAASPHLKIKDTDPDFRLASSVIFFLIVGHLPMSIST